jgi:hypothetical protein
VKETVQAITRGSAVRKVRGRVPGPKNIYRYRVEKNPRRKRSLIEQAKQAGFKSGKTKGGITTLMRYGELGQRLATKAKSEKEREAVLDAFREAYRKGVESIQRNPSTPSLASLLGFKGKKTTGRDYTWFQEEINRANLAIDYLRDYEYNARTGAESTKIISAIDRIRKYRDKVSDAFSRRGGYSSSPKYMEFKGGRRVNPRHHPPSKATRKHRRNPTPQEIREEFAGRLGHGASLYFPEGTPQGLAKLGKLELIMTEAGPIQPVEGEAWLCMDTKGRLHIGSVSGRNLDNGPRRSFGFVKRIEYDESKPHLGYHSPIIWTHKMGEENGVRPTLHADGKGGLVFRGGDYYHSERGLHN